MEAEEETDEEVEEYFEEPDEPDEPDEWECDQAADDYHEHLFNSPY